MTVEETIRSMWQRALGGGPPPGASGLRPDDNFFARGGDAVAASEVLSLIRDAYDVQVDLDSFLAAPTVRQLAQVVERQMAQGRAGDEAGVAPLAFSQEGMLWHEQFSPGSFNLPPLVRRYQGQLDVAALGRSLNDLVGRHAPLRTTFDVVAGRPVQRVTPPQPRRLPVTDLSAVDAGAQRATIAEAIADAAGRPFRLSEDPMFEPHLYKLGDEDHVLVIRLHHLVFDDWAVDVLRRELSVLYRAHHFGAAPGLPPLRVEFPEFCRRQRRRLAGDAGREELAYWRRELAGAPLSLPLPLGDPAKPQGSPFPAAVPMRHLLPPEAVQALRMLARQQRCTLFMALLGVFAVVAHSYTDHEDLVMASVVANRNGADLEGLIGCFTKKLVLRLRVPGDTTFAQVMVGARNTVLGALAHQDLAFETVVQDVLGRDANSLGVVPDISVMFQADTPHKDSLVLPGLTVGAFDTGTTARQRHFAAGEPDAEGDHQVWGAGIYPGTFLILSVVESDDGVALVARGAFHPPSVERILGRFDELLSEIIANPDHTVSQLVSSLGEPADLAAGRRRGDLVNVRGFQVEPSRIQAVVARCPGVHEAAVVIQHTPLGSDEIVVSIVSDGSLPAPTLAGVRSFLWSRLPGYAWPAAVVVVPTLPGPADDHPGVGEVGGGGPLQDRAEGVGDTTPSTPDEQRLADLWAGVLGGGSVRADANYWQKFSFVEVLRRARASGLELFADQVRRNRTLHALAADMASSRLAAEEQLHS